MVRRLHHHLSLQQMDYAQFAVWLIGHYPQLGLGQRAVGLVDRSNRQADPGLKTILKCSVSIE